MRFSCEPLVPGGCPSQDLVYSWVDQVLRRTTPWDQWFTRKLHIKFWKRRFFLDNPLIHELPQSSSMTIWQYDMTPWHHDNGTMTTVWHYDIHWRIMQSPYHIWHQNHVSSMLWSWVRISILEVLLDLLQPLHPVLGLQVDLGLLKMVTNDSPYPKTLVLSPEPCL